MVVQVSVYQKSVLRKTYQYKFSNFNGTFWKNQQNHTQKTYSKKQFGHSNLVFPSRGIYLIQLTSILLNSCVVKEKVICDWRSYIKKSSIGAGGRGDDFPNKAYL